MAALPRGEIDPLGDDAVHVAVPLLPGRVHDGADERGDVGELLRNDELVHVEVGEVGEAVAVPVMKKLLENSLLQRKNQVTL